MNCQMPSSFQYCLLSALKRGELESCSWPAFLPQLLTNTIKFPRICVIRKSLPVNKYMCSLARFLVQFCFFLFKFIHFTSCSLPLFSVILLPFSFEGGVLPKYSLTLVHQVSAGLGASFPTESRQGSPARTYPIYS